MKSYFLLIIILILVSCKKIETKIENSKFNKKENKNLDTFSIKRTSLNQEKSINKPKESEIINSKFDLKLLFGIWTYNSKSPHADFELTIKSFYVIDFDGDGNMPYIINQDTIKVYYDDFVSIGVIKNVSEDTLKIDWDQNGVTNCVKWKG